MTVQDFFRMVTMYSMYSKEEINEFVFQTFDKDGSGRIDEEEFLDLARTVNNAEVRACACVHECVIQVTCGSTVLPCSVALSSSLS
jgi:hypothetical protein